MKLYDIAPELRAVSDQLAEDRPSEAGVLSHLLQELDALEWAFEDKVASLIMAINERKAEAAAIKVEIDRLTARRQSCLKAHEGLRGYLNSCLAVSGKSSIRTTTGTASLGQPVEKIVVRNAADVPDEWRKDPKPPEPDRARMQEAYDKTGEVQSGCEVETTRTLRIT